MATFQSQINILAKAIVKTNEIAEGKLNNVIPDDKKLTITYNLDSTVITDADNIATLPYLGFTNYENIIVKQSTQGNEDGVYIDNEGEIHTLANTSSITNAFNAGAALESEYTQQSTTIIPFVASITPSNNNS